MKDLPPLPRSGPCSLRVGDELVHATHCVIGIDPDGMGCGVLYWAWSLEEASGVANTYRKHQYQNVQVCNASSPSTQDRVHRMIFGDDIS